MPREFPRSRRVGEEMHRLVSESLQRDFSDPRLALVSITEVEVASDLSIARVFFTCMNGPDHVPDATTALRSAAGRLRHLLGGRMKLRAVPQLRFEYDDSLDHGERISALLAGTRRPEPEGS